MSQTIKRIESRICKQLQKKGNTVKENGFCALIEKKLSEKLKEWLMKQEVSKMIVVTLMAKCEQKGHN